MTFKCEVISMGYTSNFICTLVLATLKMAK